MVAQPEYRAYWRHLSAITMLSRGCPRSQRGQLGPRPVRQIYVGMAASHAGWLRLG